MSRPALSRDILGFLGFFALTVLMTWPWILHLRDAVPDRGDSYAHAYWLWWDAYQTFHGPLNLFNATIFFPYKYTLAFSENDYGIGLLFSPLFALGFRAVTVHSVATLTAFAFSGYGMFRLTRTLTASNGSAWVAGIVFAFLPYRFQRLPHLPLIFAGWIPLTLEALVLFARQRSWKRATWLGVSFTMNALTCMTWFIMTLVPFGLSAVFLLMWYRVVRDRDFWIRTSVVFGVVSLALLCFMFPYYRVHQLYGFARSAADATDLSAYPIHWLAASPRNKLWNGLGGKAAIDELTLFPGLLPPLLALAAFFLVKPVSRQIRALKVPKIGGFIPRRTLLLLLDVLAFTLLLLALLAVGYGSIHLRLFGIELLRASHLTRPLIYFLVVIGVRFLIAYPEVVRRIIRQNNFIETFRSNPRSVALILGVVWFLIGFLGSFGMHFFVHRILFEFVPFFKSMRVPARWAMICYVGLSILAGLGAQQFVELLKRWRPRVPRIPVYALLCVMVLFEQRAVPVEFFHGEVDPDALTLRLKATPMSGGIVELPAERNSYAYFRYMLRAADHGRPIVTASSSFAPPIVEEIESLTLKRPIPDRLITLLEEIPASYLVIHNSLLSLPSRLAIESVVARGIAAGRIRFVNSYGDSTSRDDLYAITKTEPKAQTEAPVPIQASLNPIDHSYFFIRQQYLDIVNREPEPTEWERLAGFISGCKGEPVCVLDHRIQAALGFFHLPELQEKSYFVYRLYKVAFGRMPKYIDWARDMDQFTQNGRQNKLAFAKDWMARAEFLDRYPDGFSNIEFVNKLLLASGQTITQAKREALIEGLDTGKMTRAEILVNVTEIPPALRRENNEAFVAMCYFNYLKRDPDSEGYNHWLQILNNSSSGQTEVIKGFIYSGEYRARFGQP